MILNNSHINVFIIFCASDFSQFTSCELSQLQSKCMDSNNCTLFDDVKMLKGVVKANDPEAVQSVTLTVLVFTCHDSILNGYLRAHGCFL